MEVSASAQPPLVVLLLHLGACAHAVKWAGARPISAETLDACPEPEWRGWLASALHIEISEPASCWIDAAKTALSSDGFGFGYGDGDGYGFGNGGVDGDGFGDGDGYGVGYADGSGLGFGSGEDIV